MPDSDSNDITRSHLQLANDTIVGHYRIIEKIGAGGMGEVYLAEDADLGRKVALKFLPVYLCQDAGCRARFKREAQAAAQLDHPNIVSVFEVGEFQGRPYFSMQYVEGKSLKEVPAAKPLSLEQVLHLGVQICDGLQAAHDKGITHRDIKPPNILIDSYGRARIADFGLAAVGGVEQLTRTGSTLGTVGYMSPEQVRGEKVDHRTDLFSFGVVLYEMITGHPPFKADSEAATLHAITNAKPELLARFRRDVPPELQTIVDKALDKNVTARYQHADELAGDLRRLSSRGATPTAKRRRRWGLYVTTTTVGVLIVLMTYWLVTRFTSHSGMPAEAKRKMLAVLPFENLGSAQEEYFADGITDEITTRLAGLSGLGVISRTSSMQYKKSTKNLKQIGKELNVEYVLEGTIRWDKTGSESRVRINPQLVRVADDSHLWAASIDAVLTDVLTAQSKIAQEVAAALNVTLLQPEQEALSHNTEVNAAAYDHYLRGKQYFSIARYQQNELKLAEIMFRKAIELAPSFAPAYAELSSLYIEMNWDQNVPSSALLLDSAKKLVDLSLSLAPNLPETRQALGWYYYHGTRDYDHALEEFSRVLEIQPNNVLALASTAWVQRRLGKWDEAIRGLETVTRLAPRDAWYKYELGLTYYLCRRYQEAVTQQDHVIDLEPNHHWAYHIKSWALFSLTGRTTEALKVLDTARATIGRWPELTWFETYYHCCDREYEPALHLLNAPGDVLFPDGADTTDYYYTKGFVCELMNRVAQARIYYDSARVQLEAKVASTPRSAMLLGSLSRVYAGLGQEEKAVQAARRAVELVPESRDALEGPTHLRNLAMVLALVGEYDQATALFDHLLSEPANVSANWLRIAPGFDALRATPAFQAMLGKHMGDHGRS